MTAGLIQLVTHGTQDIFLTGSPQITFFKLVYRRYTNFAIESVEQIFDGIIDFDKYVSCNLNKNGDLINRVYLEVIIPEVQLLKQDLNPEYLPPISNNITSVNENFGKAFRPDDLLYALNNESKRNSEILFYTFKILFDHLNNIYKYSIQQIENGVDLDISKNIDGKYPEESFISNLLINLVYIDVDQITGQFIANYYSDFFKLTENEIKDLTNFVTTKQFSYSFIINNIIKERFYKSDTNLNKYLPEINYERIDLKQIIEDFFNNTIDELIDDQDRENILKNILNQWYIDAKEVYLFLQKQFNKNKNNLEDTISPYVKFAWIEKLGHYIAEYIEVYIGGKKIDKHYSDWMNIWYELSKNVYHDKNYKKMIGDIDIMKTYNNHLKPQYKLYIPLQFWFCRHNGLALPLVSLRYHDIKINIKFRKLEECAYVEEGYTLFESLHIEYASLFVDYIYLDSSERKRFASASHEYLIEQIQSEEFKNVISNKYSAELNFVHPCKEIIWTCQANRYRKNPTDSNFILNPSNYSYSKEKKGNPIVEARLEFNTHLRVQKLDGNYFNYVQPYQSHSNTPSDGINLYSFAIDSEKHQPSGTVNLSRINYIVMHLILNDKIFSNDSDILENNLDSNESNKFISKDLEKEVSGVLLTFYAPNYNVLRIMSGMGGLAFSA